MMPGSRGLPRFAAALAALALLSACTAEDRDQPLEQVEPIDIPAADTTTETNFNIDNPTLEIPETFPVSDGDLLTLVWSDEFNGTQLDPETWFFESGDGSDFVGDGGITGLPSGWGNNELQWYLPDNAQLENGVLKITARRETVGDFGYTSARITTRDRFAFQYGRIEASIKLPSGQGLWPAFWMLSQDSPYGSWAATGEIDIVEAANLDGNPGPGGVGGGNNIFGTIHYGGEFPANEFSSVDYTPSEDVTGGFNTYALEWDEFEIRWYFNGVLYAVQNSWFSTAAPYPAPFDQPFHVLLNLAVGGDLPGPPNGSTPFPATMEVDWVRVYSGEEVEVEPADPGIVPEVVISAADGAAPDLIPTFETFGSGSTFTQNFAGDNSYANVVQVTVGEGYGGGSLAQLGLTGLTPGFATAYGEFVFKVKGLDADNTVVAKLEEPFPGTSVPVQIDLTAPPANVTVTDLGDGWSQVVIQVAAYGDVSTFSQIVFETLTGAYPEGHRFFLADIGFNVDGSGGGGGGVGDHGPGTAAVYTETATETTITVTGITNSIDFSGNNTVADPNSTAIPAFEGNVVLSIDYQDSGKTFGGVVLNFGGVDLTSYDTLNFTVDMSGIPGFAELTIQIEPPGSAAPGTNVLLSSYTPVATSGNWATYAIPLADFPATNFAAADNLGFWNPKDASGLAFGTLYVDDVYFSAEGGGGGGGGGGGTGGNLVPDGGFEDAGTAGLQEPWFAFAEGGTVSVSSENNNGGTYAARLQADASSGTPSFPQLKVERLGTGTFTGGEPVTVTFDAIDVDTAGAGKVFVAEFFTERADPPGGATSEVLLGGYGLSGTWQTFTFNTTLAADAAGGVSLLFKADCGGNTACTMDVFIDNVSIVVD